MYLRKESVPIKRVRPDKWRHGSKVACLHNLALPDQTIYQSVADTVLSRQVIHGDTVKQLREVQELQYTRVIAFCLKNRKLMRQILERANLLRQFSDRGCQGYEVGGVDSSVRQVNSYFATTVVGQGVSCNYHRETMNTSASFCCQQDFNLSVLVDYLRSYLEAVLLTPLATADDYAVILDQSYSVILSTIIKTVQNYHQYLQELTIHNDNYDEFTKYWSSIMRLGLGHKGIFSLMFGNPKVIGMTKASTSGSLTRYMQEMLFNMHNIKSADLNILTDRRLLEFILESGEYIVPQVLSLGNYKIYAEIEKAYEELPNLFRESFVAIPSLLNYFVQDSVISGEWTNSEAWQEQVANRIHYTYCRPYNSNMVYRLEFHGSLLFDGTWFDGGGCGEQFQELLNAINYSFSFRYMEPDNQYLADKLAKEAVMPWDKLILAGLTQLQNYYLANQSGGDLPLASILQFLSNRYRT